MNRLKDYDKRVKRSAQCGNKLQSLEELLYAVLTKTPKKKAALDEDVCRKMMYPINDITAAFSSGIENKLQSLEKQGKACHDSFGYWSRV